MWEEVCYSTGDRDLMYRVRAKASHTLRYNKNEIKSKKRRR